MNKAFQLYTDFVSNNWDFDSLNKEDKSTIIKDVEWIMNIIMRDAYLNFDYVKKILYE